MPHIEKLKYFPTAKNQRDTPHIGCDLLRTKSRPYEINQPIKGKLNMKWTRNNAIY